MHWEKATNNNGQKIVDSNISISSGALDDDIDPPVDNKM